MSSLSLAFSYELADILNKCDVILFRSYQSNLLNIVLSKSVVVELVSDSKILIVILVSMSHTAPGYMEHKDE